MSAAKKNPGPCGAGATGKGEKEMVLLSNQDYRVFPSNSSGRFQRNPAKNVVPEALDFVPEGCYIGMGKPSGESAAVWILKARADNG